MLEEFESWFEYLGEVFGKLFQEDILKNSWRRNDREITNSFERNKSFIQERLNPSVNDSTNYSNFFH